MCSFLGTPPKCFPPNFFVSYIAYYFWRFIAVSWLITLLIIVVIKWGIRSLFLYSLSYGILDEFDTKTFKELYPSFANDMYAQSYLNDVDDPINPDDFDEDLLLDDIVSIISSDAVMPCVC